MKYEIAHLQDRNTQGQLINFVVFNAKPLNNTASERNQLLNQLMMAAHSAGLAVDAGALVYEEHGQLQCWGDKFTRSWIEYNGIPQMTQTLDVS